MDRMASNMRKNLGKLKRATKTQNIMSSMLVHPLSGCRKPAMATPRIAQTIRSSTTMRAEIFQSRCSTGVGKPKFQAIRWTERNIKSPTTILRA